MSLSQTKKGILSPLSFVPFLSLMIILFLSSISKVNAAEATLRWNGNSETDIDSYNVYWGTSSGNYDNSKNVGNVTNNTVTGLIKGVTYFFAVTASDASFNESGFSNEVSFTIPVISDLTVKSNATYEIVENGLQKGAQVFTDRSYAFNDIPAAYNGTTYIRTADNDKASSGNQFLTFVISHDVTVYVAYDNRITTKPSWMLEFTDTGDDIIVTTGTGYSLFKKDYSAGIVSLGGNEGTGKSMYIEPTHKLKI